MASEAQSERVMDLIEKGNQTGYVNLRNKSNSKKMTQERIMFSNPTPSEPRLFPAATYQTRHQRGVSALV